MSREFVEDDEWGPRETYSESERKLAATAPAISSESANDDSLECQRTTTEPGGEPAPGQTRLWLSNYDWQLLEELECAEIPMDMRVVKAIEAYASKENADLRRQLKECEAERDEAQEDALKAIARAGREPEFAKLEQLVIEIARELYDRFVMGGWEPRDAYPQIRVWLGTVVDFEKQHGRMKENASPSPGGEPAPDIFSERTHLLNELELAKQHVASCEQENADLRRLLKQIIADLPNKRDWLDPVLEAEARERIRELEK